MHRSQWVGGRRTGKNEGKRGNGYHHTHPGQINPETTNGKTSFGRKVWQDRNPLTNHSSPQATTHATDTHMRRKCFGKKENIYLLIVNRRAISPRSTEGTGHKILPRLMLPRCDRVHEGVYWWHFSHFYWGKYVIKRENFLPIWACLSLSVFFFSFFFKSKSKIVCFKGPAGTAPGHTELIWKVLVGLRVYRVKLSRSYGVLLSANEVSTGLYLFKCSGIVRMGVFRNTCPLSLAVDWIDC